MFQNTPWNNGDSVSWVGGIVMISQINAGPQPDMTIMVKLLKYGS